MTISLDRSPTRNSALLSADDAADARAWDALIDGAHLSDVYYRPGYVAAYQQIGHGKAVAAVVEACGVRALFPLMLRPLGALSIASGESGFDATTPYGYGGMTLLDGVERIDGEVGRGLLREFRTWCCDHHAVSAHVRLHPILEQEGWFQGGLGAGLELRPLGQTTAIDVRCWGSDTSQNSTLGKGRRADLKFARRHLRLTWSSGGRDAAEGSFDAGTSEDRSLQSDLQHFYDLYERRMTELGADEFYHFAPVYYDSLAGGLKGRLDIGIAWLEDEPVAAALFMTGGPLAHYHLSACSSLGRAHKATTLILDGAAQRARRRHCQHLHLGGGVHGDDQLFAFKKSFGGAIYRYAALSVICDSPRHRELVLRRVSAPGLPPPRTNFFPEYRA